VILGVVFSEMPFWNRILFGKTGEGAKYRVKSEDLPIEIGLQKSAVNR